MTTLRRAFASGRSAAFRWARSRRALLVAVWAGALALLTLQPATWPIDAGLDPSWRLGLDMAIEQHLQWGTQVIWTFGPYGFAHLPALYFQDIWLSGLIFELSVHALLFAVLACYLARIAVGPAGWLLVTVLFLFPVLQFLTLEVEGELAAVLLLYLSGTAPGSRLAMGAGALAGCVIALLLTVKGTGMATAAALVPIYGALVVRHRRPLLLLPLLASIAAALVVLWTAAGQSLGNLYPYFRSSYEIISGYTAAMSILYEYRLTYVWEQLAFGVLLVLSSVGLLSWALWHRDRRLVFLLLLTLPLLFATYRYGYVRFGNQVHLYGLAAVIEALVLLHVVRSSPRPRVAAVQPAAFGAVSLLLVSGVGYAAGAVSLAPNWPLSSAVQRLGTYATAAELVVHPDRRAALAAAGAATIRASDPLAPRSVALLADGRTDVWPWDIDLTYAYGLRWAPRPVLQSYSAYTSYLDGADAAYVEGPQAPEHVLIAARSVDGRYMPFDEPAAFRALSRRYAVEARDGDFLVLSRRGPPAPAALRPLLTVHARLGDVVTVPSPAGGRVYASVSVPYSLSGRLQTELFQPGELHIDLRLTDGTTARHRLIPGVAGDGLMLGTYIGSTADLEAYLEGGRPRPIRALRVTSERPSDYTGAVDVTFSADS